MLKCIKAFIRPKSLSFYLMLFNAIKGEGRGLMLLIGHIYLANHVVHLCFPLKLISKLIHAK